MLVNITSINININTQDSIQWDAHVYKYICHLWLLFNPWSWQQMHCFFTHGMNRFCIPYAPATVLTSRWLAASNNCALCNLYYLVLFALDARSNPYLAGTLVIVFNLQSRKH
jgi:hypothetical protein